MTELAEGLRKKKVIEALNKSREKRFIKRDQVGGVEILASCQVSKKESLYFHTYLTIIRVQTEWYVVSHDKLLPKVNDLRVYVEGNDWNRVQMDQMGAEIIVSGIKVLQKQDDTNGWTRREEYNLSNYAFLMGWCMAQGLDLVNAGVFDT